MFSPASAIFTSIVTILVSFAGILKRFTAWMNFKSQFQSDDLPQALKEIKIASNLQVLWQYLWIWHLQVNTFIKYWVNTREYYHNTYEYCHNTCEYWAGEYTLSDWGHQVTEVTRWLKYKNWWHLPTLADSYWQLLTLTDKLLILACTYIHLMTRTNNENMKLRKRGDKK